MVLRSGTQPGQSDGTHVMVKLQEKEGVEPEYIWLRSAMSGEYSGVLVQLHRWLNNEGTELRSAPIFASPRQRARNLDGTDPLGHLLQSLRAELQGFDKIRCVVKGLLDPSRDSRAVEAT